MSLTKCGAIIAMLLLLAACDDPEGARHALQAYGFTEIKTTGYEWLGCAKDDMFHTGFEAMNPQGLHVTGIVCSGWFKGSTVRLF